MCIKRDRWHDLSTVFFTVHTYIRYANINSNRKYTKFVGQWHMGHFVSYRNTSIQTFKVYATILAHTTTTLEVFLAPLLQSKQITVYLKEILYHPFFVIHCNVVLMSPSCSSPLLHSPPLGETGEINMAGCPPLVSDRWTLGFSLELQIRAQIDAAASHTCRSTQLCAPLRARLCVCESGGGFSPIVNGSLE